MSEAAKESADQQQQLAKEQLEALNLVNTRADALAKHVKHHRVRRVQATMLATLAFGLVTYGLYPVHYLLSGLAGAVAAFLVLWFAWRRWNIEKLPRPAHVSAQGVEVHSVLILVVPLSGFLIKEGPVAYFAGILVILAVQSLFWIREVRGK